MRALIDGDIVAYRCAASAEQDDVSIALWRVDDLMERILANTNADTFNVYLGGRYNFRKVVDPLYKANRVAPKPIHLEACRDHLQLNWSAELQLGIETDDRLGIEQSDDTVICSIDKDLRQIPGLHYNFVKDIQDEVDEYTGWYNFYRSFLIGDKSDNIHGIRGLGPAKAEKLLHGLTPEEMFTKVRELYLSLIHISEPTRPY